MDVEELRARLRRVPPAHAVYGDDGTEGRDQAATPAAVLVPVVLHAELTVLFTQRTAHLKSHAGQVSFPGGRAEPGDPSAEFTALREAEEEIGLPARSVEVLARLPDYRTRTGFRVTPVVGLVRPPLALAPDPREVAEVFEVPLSFLLDPANRRRESREIAGLQRRFYAFTYKEHEIWGATAAIIVNLAQRLDGINVNHAD